MNSLAQKTVLIPADQADMKSIAGHHFGRAQYYLIVDENGVLVESIPGTKDTQHALIFKFLKKRLDFAMPQAVLVYHMGNHAYKVAEKFGVTQMRLTHPINTKEAATAYFAGQLTPLNPQEIHQHDYGTQTHDHAENRK